MLTLAQAIDLDAELEAMQPPPVIKRAGKTIITMAASGGRPPQDLIQLVQGWMGRRLQQNRYGI
jgi:hypothetical protein